MEISDLMNRVFSFEEMASFMTKASLYPDKYVEIVAGAPIPLTEKVELFRRLSTENEYPAAAWALKQAEAALAALDTKLGDFLLVSEYWYNPKTGRDDCSTLLPCTDIEQARRAIHDYMKQEEITEDDMRWFGIEKWELNEEGKYVDPYSYTLIGDEIVFFHTWDWSDYEDNDGSYLLSLIFSQSNNLNLPLPVKPGDIVQFDCMPFVGRENGVILETNINGFVDCCTVQALHRWKDGRWKSGAVKHSNVFPRLASPYFSPLYRLAPVEVSELSKEDRILAEVSEFVQVDEDRGHALYNAITSDDGMEEAELRQFIETWGE